MPWSLQWQLALRQTLDPGKGLSAFLSRVSIVGIALAIALLLAVQSVMNGFDREMRERILTLIPHVQIMGNASRVEWQQLQVSLHSTGDLERLEQQLEPLLLAEPGRQLLLLEQSGSLSLEAHQRYGELLERLEAQLLRLKQRGTIEQAPDPGELTQLIERAEDPLIAGVAAGLQNELEQSGSGEHQEQRQLLQLALAELHRAAGVIPCA